MRQQSGFTLVEVMVTLVVGAILLGIAVPAMQDFVRNNRMISQVNGFLGALSWARAEASKRGKRITMCPSTDAATCAGSSWETGMLIFVDEDADGVLDAGEELLRVGEALSGSNTLRAEDAVLATYISFKPTGFAAANGYFTEKSWRLCDSRGTADARTISINGVGRASSTTTATACP